MSILSFLIGPVMAATISCPVMPYGQPNDQSNLEICHKGYFTEYDYNDHIPVFVGWRVTKDMSISCNSRNGSFKQDPLAMNKDVPSSAYDNTGYDRGHMANAGDFYSDNQEETESFYMTNILPQDPTNNRSGWKYLESVERNLAYQYGNIQIYAGDKILSSTKKINDVTVPDYLWKVIYIESLNQTISVFVPNTPIKYADILKYRTSVSDIEERIGKTIYLPSSYDKTKIDKFDFTKIDLNFMTKEKQKECKIK